MPYLPSEKCNYMSLKPTLEWKVSGNKTSIEAKDRFNKLLTTNLRQKPYQRARDNNIKRWLELKDKLQYESPTDYIDKMVQAYVNDEIKITDIFIQSSTSPIRSGAAPQRCYLLGKRNVIKAKSYEELVSDFSNDGALEALLISDINLLFERNIVDNSRIEHFVWTMANNKDYYLEGLMRQWEHNIKKQNADELELVAPK